MTTTLTIPAGPRDLTPEWVTDALRSTGVIRRAAVKGIEATVVGVGSGFVGQVARVSLSYDDEERGAPASVIAKFPGTSERGRAAGHAFDLYHREIRFYREIATEGELRKPRHYYSAADPRAKDYVLLVEDLAPLEVGDQLQGWTVAQARLAVESIAKFHALWWESPRLEEIGAWMPTTDGPAQRHVAAAYELAWGPFLDMFGSSLSAEVKAVGEEIGRKAVKLQSSLAASPRTVTHGDFRMDNLFFSTAKGGAPFAAADWQISTIGRGAFDVAFLLCSSAEPQLRLEYQRELLELYHRTLELCGVKGYAFETLWDDYRRSALYHFSYVVVGLGTADAGNERGMALFGAWLRRGVAALQDLNAVELMPE